MSLHIKGISTDYKDDSAGTLSIGTTHTQARYVLPAVIKVFRLFATLGEVIEYYNAPDKVVPAALGRDASMSATLDLTTQEKADLEQFLMALTDDRFRPAPQHGRP